MVLYEKPPCESRKTLRSLEFFVLFFFFMCCKLIALLRIYAFLGHVKTQLISHASLNCLSFSFSCLCCPLQAKLAELQDLVMRLVAERNDWYSRYAGAMAGAGAANPDLLPVQQDSSLQEHGAYSHTEPDATSGAGTSQRRRHLLSHINPNSTL